MPLQQFTDAELHAKAVQLGIITDEQDLPRQQRSKVAAALLQERQAAHAEDAAPEPVLAGEIVVQPGGAVLVDGAPFPWLIAKQAMEIGLNPDGISTVRLTLMAGAVQVLKPKQNPDQSESE
ncbi:hypothetical protein C9F11_37320 [Streptomyces sp. YIM 121038]|uniref:hypothetical protein n=1 Tax=Streptomyces sp. YIM 121038 TaxID=2136401 RepID=UPI00111081F3|nr:hypothetical protein [Streptomyces sp. YIM 121038]QCX81047.1 hypothetical protein C9F11_37320 [Streptomyces sp. YIM 121038]